MNLGSSGHVLHALPPLSERGFARVFKCSKASLTPWLFGVDRCRLEAENYHRRHRKEVPKPLRNLARLPSWWAVVTNEQEDSAWKTLRRAEGPGSAQVEPQSGANNADCRPKIEIMTSEHRSPEIPCVRERKARAYVPGFRFIPAAFTPLHGGWNRRGSRSRSVWMRAKVFMSSIRPSSAIAASSGRDISITVMSSVSEG